MNRRIKRDTESDAASPRPVLLEVETDPATGRAREEMAAFLFGGSVPARALLDPAPVPEARSLFTRFFEAADLASALQEAARIFSSLSGGRARLEVAATTRHGCRVRVFGSKKSREACRTALGFFRKVAELSTGEHVRAEETRCSFLGDECCEYAFHYLPGRSA